MPAQRKRKHPAVEDQPAGKQTRTTKTQKSINAFGIVGKQHGQEFDAKKRKTVHQRDATPPPGPVPQGSAKADKKRKRDLDAIDEDKIVVSSRTTDLRNGDEPRQTATPQNKRIKNIAPPSPALTPIRGAAALFDRLKIDANARASPCTLPAPQLSYGTPPDTPAEEKDNIDLTFPEELEDLQDLYSSFLASLSLYYSHNGTTSPVQINELLPIIAKHWKKRSVKLQDIQRMLAVSSKQDSSFSLQDYGRGGICLTRAQARGQALKRAASYIDEDELNSRFENSLQKLWHSWQTTVAKENRTAAAFLDQLPLFEVALNESVEKAAPVLARGQQRLADLKAGQAAAKVKAAKTTPETAVAQKSIQATQSRGTALLDRILAKQNVASNLPSGPTKAQLERKSALDRIEDISRILSLLVGTKDRSSYSMPAITQQLQQSLRNPISREEVDRCLGLMSTEIVPGFVKVVQSGEVRGMVVMRSGNIGLSQLRERIERACA